MVDACRNAMCVCSFVLFQCNNYACKQHVPAVRIPDRANTMCMAAVSSSDGHRKLAVPVALDNQASGKHRTLGSAWRAKTAGIPEP